MNIDLPKLICTIGPSCNTEETLSELKRAGVDIFRVNMSHASTDDLYKVQKIAKKIDIKIGIDTEGAQIRVKLNTFKKEKCILCKGDNFKVKIASESFKLNFFINFFFKISNSI